MEHIYTIFVVFSAIIGLVVGSFLNVCIARLPVFRSVVPRSACPQCGTGIAWFDNIPVLSWLILRGSCRTCQGTISGSNASREWDAASHELISGMPPPMAGAH